MSTVLNEMKEEIRSQRETIKELTMQLGFAKGKDALYEKLLEENLDLKRQLEDEIKVRKIMREAMNEYVKERDTAMKMMSEAFSLTTSSEDLPEVIAGSIVKFLELKKENDKARTMGPMKEEEYKEYVVILMDGVPLHVKARTAEKAKEVAFRYGHRPSDKVMTKETYMKEKHIYEKEV